MKNNLVSLKKINIGKERYNSFVLSNGFIGISYDDRIMVIDQ